MNDVAESMRDCGQHLLRQVEFKRMLVPRELLFKNDFKKGLAGGCSVQTTNGPRRARRLRRPQQELRISKLLLVFQNHQSAS